MPQRAKRRQPAAPQILFRQIQLWNVGALRVDFSNLNLRHSIDSNLSE
jgi:hypothetical protein